MHGRGVMATILLAAGVLGCGDARPQSPAVETPSSEASRQFDLATAGSVSGCVRWTAEVPVVPPILEPVNPFIPSGPRDKTPWPNPNAPVIDPATHGVQGAVVYLRGVDASRSRPWDLPPVRVVQEGRQIHVRQGPSDLLVGFVHRGDPVEMISADPVFYSLHAGGAAFFTLAFPDPDRPRMRRLTERGVVELSSAAGQFWTRGYLFVDDHPYYTRTDAAGGFDLTGVPPGHYEAVCWLPDWHEARHERDPETLLVTRLFFRPPWETVRPVEVSPNGTTTVEFAVAPP